MRTRHLMAMAVAVALVCCGGSSNSDDDDDDSGPPHQGAFVAAFSSVSNVAGMTCDKDLHNGQVGFVDASEIKQLMSDGEYDVELDCSVVSSGAGFTVMASIAQNTTSFSVALSGVTGAATEASPATGEVSYQTAQTVRVYTSPPQQPCSFWFTGDQEVAAGRAWLSFECPAIVNSETNTACALSAGSALAVQNCDR